MRTGPDVDSRKLAGLFHEYLDRPDFWAANFQNGEVIHPETTFERIIFQCLERGTLHNQLFDNPESFTQKALRGIVGGFLKLYPVKRALMSDTLRSRFLDSMKTGAEKRGQGWALEL